MKNKERGIRVGAFCDELEKMAFGWDDIARVGRLSKKVQMRLPGRMLDALGGRLAAVPVGRRKGLAKMVGRESANSAMRATIPLEGKVLVGRRGGAIRSVISRKDARALSGREKRMAESVLKGHELDELALGRSGTLSTQFASHVSPDVILRERNRLVTLPKGGKKVRELLAAHREGSGEADIFRKATRGVGGKTMDYGTGPRLSRHARKRVSGRMLELLESM